MNLLNKSFALNSRYVPNNPPKEWPNHARSVRLTSYVCSMKGTNSSRMNARNAAAPPVPSGGGTP
jgi:hypothetical protein